MAKATRKTAGYVLNLELSEEEAVTLCTVLHQVGGSPERSRRKHAGQVLKALLDADVRHAHESVDRTRKEYRGIYFLNDEE